MKKEELIEKYPNVLVEIMLDLIKKCNNKPELLNEVWNEYLVEIKPKSDFQVRGIKIPHQKELWLSDKTNHFCSISGRDVIEYEKALLIGEIKSVVYKGIQYSIDDVVQYLDKTYTITSFNKERVHLKERNENNYQNLHISEISKIKPLGITEDGFECYEKDNVHWIIFNRYNKWKYLYDCTLSESHFLKNGKLYNEKYKIFKLKENALKFIEENTPKSLFTTTDNTQIFDKEQVLYLVNNKTCAMIEIKAKDWDKTRLIYASKTKAEEYILNHARVLSYAEVSDSLDSDYSKEYLLNLVKERLNQK